MLSAPQLFILTAISDLVGIRFPDHELARAIIEETGPITSTSANRTGSPSPISAGDVSREIAERVDKIIDGGKSLYAQASTLLDLENRIIIRPGAGLEKVQKAIS